MGKLDGLTQPMGKLDGLAQPMGELDGLAARGPLRVHLLAGRELPPRICGRLGAAGPPPEIAY